MLCLQFQQWRGRGRDPRGELANLGWPIATIRALCKVRDTASTKKWKSNWQKHPTPILNFGSPHVRVCTHTHVHTSTHGTSQTPFTFIISNNENEVYFKICCINLSSSSNLELESFHIVVTQQNYHLM